MLHTPQKHPHQHPLPPTPKSTLQQKTPSTFLRRLTIYSPTTHAHTEEEEEKKKGERDAPAKNTRAAQKQKESRKETQLRKLSARYKHGTKKETPKTGKQGKGTPAEESPTKTQRLRDKQNIMGTNGKNGKNGKNRTPIKKTESKESIKNTQNGGNTNKIQTTPQKYDLRNKHITNHMEGTLDKKHDLRPLTESNMSKPNLNNEQKPTPRKRLYGGDIMESNILPSPIATQTIEEDTTRIIPKRLFADFIRLPDDRSTKSRKLTKPIQPSLLSSDDNVFASSYRTQSTKQRDLLSSSPPMERSTNTIPAEDIITTPPSCRSPILSSRSSTPYPASAYMTPPSRTAPIHPLPPRHKKPRDAAMFSTRPPPTPSRPHLRRAAHGRNSPGPAVRNFAFPTMPRTPQEPLPVYAEEDLYTGENGTLLIRDLPEIGSTRLQRLRLYPNVSNESIQPMVVYAENFLTWNMIRTYAAKFWGCDVGVVMMRLDGGDRWKELVLWQSISTEHLVGDLCLDIVRS